MTIKLTAYQKILTFTKEKIQEGLAPIRAREMRKKAELEMAKIEGTILTNEQSMQELCSKYPIDFDKVIDKIDEVELLERRKGQFQKICDEMFPED